MRSFFIENTQNGLNCINILPKMQTVFFIMNPRYSDRFSTTDSEQLRMVIALLYESQAYSNT